MGSGEAHDINFDHNVSVVEFGRGVDFISQLCNFKRNKAGKTNVASNKTARAFGTTSYGIRWNQTSNLRGSVSASKQKFHHDGRVRRVGVIAGRCPDNSKSEFPIEPDHCRVTATSVGDNAREAVKAGV